MLFGKISNFKSLKIHLYIFVSILVCSSVIYTSLKLHDKSHDYTEKLVTIEQVVSDIRYLDEVLTKAAKLAAMTGNLAYEERYRIHEKELDKTIKTALEIAPIGSTETDIANQKLIEMENRAFAYVRNNNADEAIRILNSEKYHTYKKQYQEGFKSFYRTSKAIVEKIHNDHDRILFIFEIINVVGVLFIALSTYIGYQSVRRANKLRKIAGQYERMATLGRFSAGIAHEVNNAMQPVLGQSDILRTRLKNKEGLEDEAEKANLIYESSLEVKEIVDNVLAHTRGTASQKELNLAHVFFVDITEMAEKLLPPTIVLNHDFDAMDEDAKLRLNQTDIRQTVKNIVLNAAHAMDNKGEILIRGSMQDIQKEKSKQYALEKGLYCMLSVTDTGHGMDEKTQESIFEPFFTTKEEGDGSGLGLSVSYGIMRSLGGTMVVESKKGAGTSFHLFFPVEQ